ncbi:MAG: TIGR03757 family integrating conjugative element protein [Candidatus Thiodiazotropha endolucinida]|nr:TIGR03757 family integrating conjugative element protein [Candidatus Thiodiazotropha endolucinida]
MNPFYFLVSLLIVIAICPVEAATPGDSVPIVEVFTTKEQRVRSDSHVKFLNPDQGIDLQVYHLDGIQQFESALSKQLSNDFKKAKQTALQRLQQLDEKLMESMQQAAVGLTKAMQYGLDRYPAIVFDSQTVVFGITDLEQALRLYRQWQEASQP